MTPREPLTEQDREDLLRAAAKSQLWRVAFSGDPEGPSHARLTPKHLPDGAEPTFDAFKLRGRWITEHRGHTIANARTVAAMIAVLPATSRSSRSGRSFSAWLVASFAKARIFRRRAPTSQAIAPVMEPGSGIVSPSGSS